MKRWRSLLSLLCASTLCVAAQAGAQEERANYFHDPFEQVTVAANRKLTLISILGAPQQSRMHWQP